MPNRHYNWPGVKPPKSTPTRSGAADPDRLEVRPCPSRGGRWPGGSCRRPRRRSCRRSGRCAGRTSTGGCRPRPPGRRRGSPCRRGAAWRRRPTCRRTPARRASSAESRWPRPSARSGGLVVARGRLGVDRVSRRGVGVVAAGAQQREREQECYQSSPCRHVQSLRARPPPAGALRRPVASTSAGSGTPGRYVVRVRRRPGRPRTGVRSSRSPCTGWPADSISCRQRLAAGSRTSPSDDGVRGGVPGRPASRPSPSSRLTKRACSRGVIRPARRALRLRRTAIASVVSDWLAGPTAVGSTTPSAAPVMPHAVGEPVPQQVGRRHRAAGRRRGAPARQARADDHRRSAAA